GHRSICPLIRRPGRSARSEEFRRIATAARRRCFGSTAMPARKIRCRSCPTIFAIAGVEVTPALTRGRGIQAKSLSLLRTFRHEFVRNLLPAAVIFFPRLKEKIGVL